MKIGELATAAGLKASAIRFYEASGLLPPGRRGPNGYRDYGPDALKRLQMIQLAQRLGFSLEQLRPLFATGQELPQAQVLAGIAERRAEIARLQAALRAQDKELRRLHADCERQWARGECVELESAAPASGFPAATRRRGGQQ